MLSFRLRVFEFALDFVREAKIKQANVTDGRVLLVKNCKKLSERQ